MSPVLRKTAMQTRIVIGLMVGAGLLVLVLANTHLVYVAVTSQPECVAHLKSAGETSGSFRAAKPAC
jgi:hypothetical protein